MTPTPPNRSPGRRPGRSAGWVLLAALVLLGALWAAPSSSAAANSSSNPTAQPEEPAGTNTTEETTVAEPTEPWDGPGGEAVRPQVTWPQILVLAGTPLLLAVIGLVLGALRGRSRSIYDE